MLQITQSGADVLIAVKVVPKSSRDQIAGMLGDALKVTVSAAPERGKANEAMCRVIATALGVRAAQVSVDAGHGSPRKTVRVRDMQVDAVRAALEKK
jgi:uncharacterized protein (TIGR00251 family)